MSDLISRADAIKAVAEHFSFDDGCSNIYKDIDYYKGIAEHILKNVPSAKQVTSKLKNPCDSLITDDSDECKEQKSKLESADAVQGEWIHDGQNFKGGLDWCHCSVCGQKTSTNGLSMYNFCPNCGARMKGGDDE